MNRTEDGRTENGIVRAALLVLVVAGGLWLAGQLAPVLVSLVVALVLVGTLNPLCAALVARGLGRTLSVAVILVATVALLVALGLLTVPALAAQLRDLVEHAPVMQERLAARLAGSHLTARLGGLVAAARLGDLIPSGKQAFAYTSEAVAVVGWGLTTFALAFYFLADPRTVNAAVYGIVPRRFHLRLARISLNLETIVGGYMRGQIVTSVLMTAFTFVLLKLCAIENPLPLAIFAGITDVLPLIGGILGAVPLLVAALPHGTAVVAIVLVGVVVYQEIENRIIIPRVYGRSLRLPAWAITLSLLVGAKLMGITGALLALPVAAGIRMILLELRVELPGDSGGVDPRILARDQRVETLYQELAQGAGAAASSGIALEIAEKVRDADAAASPKPAAEAVVPLTAGR
jgi:predicted PurR-regulated permease PerM